MIPNFSGRPSAASRPNFRVCYLCGQQFGSASIGIHIPQCFQKKTAQWQRGDPATRGPRPKPPDTVNWKGVGQSVQKLNDEQFQEFASNLVPCPNCARTFLPDRLPIHMRGCKAGAGSRRAQTSSGEGSSSQRLGNSGANGKSTRATSVTRRGPATRPVLPTCYLCGQQFGSSSIGIHVPQCYQKKMAQWLAADHATRGKPPKDPSTVNWAGEGLSTEEQSDAQFQEFVSNLEPCPHCGRRFLADRLQVHLRSCKPGSSAKRIFSSSGPLPSSSEAERDGKHDESPPGPSLASSAPPAVRKKVQFSTTHDDGLKRVHPMKNRLPHNSTADASGHACPRCGIVEHDTAAKFCRECGTNLSVKSLPDPCSHCGESTPEGSRFCATCGHPVHGACASERVPGDGGAIVPSVRMTTCPACRAVCDADGNFCDNCGAALGDAEPIPMAASCTALPLLPTTRAYVVCASCGECFDDLTIKFCEDCGETLEPQPCPKDDERLPPHTRGTLSPSEVGGQTAGASVDLRPRAPPSTAVGKSTTPHGDPVKAVGATTTKRYSPAPPVSAVADAEVQNTHEVVDVGERHSCPKCGRSFAEGVYERHVQVCNNTKRRKIFDASKHRLEEEAAVAARSGGKTSAKAPPKKDWKAESEAFRRALREARQVDAILKAGGTAKDLPPPTYSENPDYVQCPHCQRRFAADTAERHIPRCATTVNRPKPPPKRRR